MTALDRLLIKLRFGALLAPAALLLWLPSQSLPLTVTLAVLLAIYNTAALLASRRREPRVGASIAMLLLALDHFVISGWILLFASQSTSMPYLLYSLVAAEAVFRFDLWGGVATSLFFTSGIILFQTGDLGFAISVRDAVLRAIPTVAAIGGLGIAVRATNTEVRGTRRRLHQTEQLRSVLGELVGQLDMGRMLYTVIRCGMEMLQMDSGAVVLQDEDRGIFVLRAVVRMPEALEGSHVPAGNGIVGRVVREQSFEMGEYVIPPGVEINPSIAGIHRRPDRYPQPREFRPERFLADDAPDTYTWLPFGGGTRRCLGASFATFEMRAVIRRVLERCELEAVGAKPEGGVRKGITLVPRHGARVRQHAEPKVAPEAREVAAATGG